MRRLVYTLCLCALPLTLQAERLYPEQDAVKKKMHAHLDVLAGLFEAQYAPKEYKQQQGIDLAITLQEAKERVLQYPRISEDNFQQIVSDLLASLRDYHVSAWFLSEEEAFLPFQVKASSSGRYYLVYIDRQQLDESSFPCQVGDEVLLFDGQPIATVVEALKPRCSNMPATDQALAEIALTHRMRARGQEVPQGPLSLTVQRQATGQIITRQIIWDYRTRQEGAPASLDDYYHNPLRRASTRIGGSWQLPALGKTLKTKRNENPFVLGAENRWLPDLGPILWQRPTSPFSPYIYLDSSQRAIGYLRIATYDGGEEEAFSFFDDIAYLQENTDALIIDQTSNGGGSLFYTYALLSCLTDTPLTTPREQVKITSSDAFFASLAWTDLDRISNTQEAQDYLGDTLDGYPVTYMMVRFLADYCRFIVRQWEDGQHLSDPIWPYAVDHINPHPTVCYTHPIVILVNELDFSCADFFPAILQDNQRAKIFGTPTAGAGGAVIPVRFANEFGLSFFSVTVSLAHRPQDLLIENTGVTPDVLCPLTDEDLQAEFVDYQHALQGTLDGLFAEGA